MERWWWLWYDDDDDDDYDDEEEEEDDDDDVDDDDDDDDDDDGNKAEGGEKVGEWEARGGGVGGSYLITGYRGATSDLKWGPINIVRWLLNIDP